MFEITGDYTSLVTSAGQILDTIGVIFIFGGAITSTLVGIIDSFKTDDLHAFYRSYRYNIARSIITGLDFLVAGDIIRTVAGELTLQRVLTLGIIVIVRIIISLEFELTLYGRWPWQRKKSQI